MGGIVMAWVKCDTDDLINLDKTTDIHIEKVQDKKCDYVYDIRFYTGIDYLFKRYASLEECTHAFEYLIKCIESGKQYIDITNIP